MCCERKLVQENQHHLLVACVLLFTVERVNSVRTWCGRWLGSVTVRTLDLRLRDRGPGRVAIKLLVPGWVTVYGQVNHLGI